MFLWPKRAFVFAFFLLVIIVGTGVWAYREWPAQLFPYRDVDRWAAEAAGIGAGAFLLACFATALAFGAYVNSTEKPELSISDESTIERFWGSPPPIKLTSEIRLPLDMANEKGRGHLRGWQLNIVLNNSGSVAARYVAVRVSFTRAYLQRFAIPWVVPRAGDFPNWMVTMPRHDSFQWEGGANTIIHRDWPYHLPTLGDADTEIHSGAYADSSDEFVDSTEMLIEVIADDFRVRRYPYTIRFELPTPPPPAP